MIAEAISIQCNSLPPIKLFRLLVSFGRTISVKVAFDLSESNQDSITKIMKVVHGNVNNINLLGDKVLKLEKKVEELEAHVEAYANREI